MIAHLHMTRQGRIVRKHDFVAHRAIVSNVTIGEKISAAADPRFSFTGRAAIDSDEFAKRVLVADIEVGWFALIFQILRLLANRAVSIELVSRAGARWPGKSDVMLQPAILAERDLRSDHAVRTNDRSGANLRPFIDNRARMNLHVTHLLRNVNISSPSETTASLT